MAVDVENADVVNLCSDSVLAAFAEVGGIFFSDLPLPVSPTLAQKLNVAISLADTMLVAHSYKIFTITVEPFF